MYFCLYFQNEVKSVNPTYGKRGVPLRLSNCAWYTRDLKVTYIVTELVANVRHMMATLPQWLPEVTTLGDINGGDTDEKSEDNDAMQVDP
jgi:hypothetical protein